MEIGKKIAILRKEKNITQLQLAQYLQVLPQTVSRWELDNSAPDIYLLPKIAGFFNVSLEELFGITNDDKLNNLIYKYSVLRDDNSYNEVTRRIELELEVARQDKNKTRENELLAKKIHLYIQQGRECVVQAKAKCELLLEKPSELSKDLYLRLELQKTQLRIDNGEGRAVLSEAKMEFENTPDLRSLMKYMVALHELCRDDEILALREKSCLKELLAKKDNWSEEIYGFLLYSTRWSNNLGLYEQLYEELKEFAGKDAIFEAKIGLAKLYAQCDMIKEKDSIIKELFEDVKKVENEYMRNYMTEVITNI